MSFLDDIGNIFHSIGQFFSGGGNNDNNSPQVSNDNNNVLSGARFNGPSAPLQAPGTIFVPNGNNQNPQQQQQNQQQKPFFNLYQGPGGQPNPFALNKPGTQPAQPTQPAPQAQPQNNNPSLLDDIGNFGKSLVKAPVQFLNQAGDELTNAGITAKTAWDQATGADSNTIANDFALEKAGQDVYNQNSGGLFNMGTITSADDAKNPNVGKVAGEFGGNLIQNAALVAAPGVDSLAEKGVSTLAPDAANVISKIAPKAVSGAVTGGEFGGGNALENGQNIPEGILQGAGVGAAGGTLFGGAPLLVKAIPGVVDRLTGGVPEEAANAATKAPDEIEVGLKSANPNQGAEALQQIQEKEAQANSGVPLGQSGPGTNPQPQAGITLQGPGSQATVQGPSTPESLQPASQTQPVEPVGVNKNASSSNNVAQPEAPVNPSGKTAPNAPNMRANMTKQLSDAANAAGDPTEHDVLSNGDLKQAATNVVANTPPQELLAKYSSVPDLTKAADLSHADASMQALAQLSKSTDPQTAQAAKNAIDNIIEGAEKGLSGAGRTMNYAQSMYDNLPREAQVSLTIRTLNKALAAAGKPLIGDAENGGITNQAAVEAQIDNLLQKGEDIKQQIAAVDGRVQQIQEAAQGGLEHGDAKQLTQELQQLAKQRSTLEIQAQAQNGATARYYNSLLPGKAIAQKAADYARTSMLTAPSGRVNNLFNVGGNSLYEIARSIPQAMMNKLVDQVKGGGTTEATSLANRGLVTGIQQGAQRTASELKGNALMGDLTKATKSDDGGTYQMVRTPNNSSLGNKIVNTTQALVKAPSNIIGGGIRNAQLQRLANQEGRGLGLAGDDLKVYTQARSITPSKTMVQAAQNLQDQVSHMNKNPLAEWAGKIFGEQKYTGNTKGVIGLIKNTLLPFPKYASTFAWNTLTDRNVVADATRAMLAIKNGDMNALTKALAGGAVDGTGMYLGYHLAQQGLITDKNGAGYSDDGAYLHFGDRYIPLGFFGVGAEPVLAGVAIHNAVNSGATNPMDIAGRTIANTALDTVKMAGAQNLIGSGDTALTTAQNAFNPKTNTSPGDVAAAFGGQAVGQFIPGAFSDTNAVLNQTDLNPTHENANTKVTKGDLGVTTKNGAPSKAKDLPASTLLSLENRIPFLSQTLPRAAGTSSNDMFDRVTRGDHVGTIQAANLQKVQDQKNQIAQEIKDGVPVYTPSGQQSPYPKGVTFDNVVESQVEKGNYDNAIKGLQSKLGAMTQGQYTTKSQTQPVEDQIKQLSILKQQSLPPEFRDVYSKTSLSQWRDMGNPNKSTYNPQMYQALYQFDQALASQGVAGGSAGKPGSNESPKFYLSASASRGSSGGRSGGSASAAANLVKQNKIGSVPTLPNMDFTTNLSAKPINVNIPQVKLTAPDSLIKAHKISVASARGNYN